jgi:molecular chaperone DnaK
VIFDIDANGLVNVTAKDRATNKEQTITITGSSGLAKEEVDRLVRDAEAHAAEDKSRKEAIEARNNADALAYSVEKTLNENRDTLPAGDVSRIEAALAAVRSATSGDDAAAITRASEELQRTSHAMAEALYKARAQAGGGGTAQQPVEPEIVDAEVVEK